MRGFASDNYAGAHPRVMQALSEANVGHAPAYGNDRWTKAAEEKFRELLGADARAYFVMNGTAANVLALSAMTKAYNAVLCAASAHINVDECGAPERHTGMKLVLVDDVDGKITPATVARRLGGRGDVHRVQPKVISVSQSTELGTVYGVAELKALADFAHERGLYLHVDGARIANAAAGLGVGFKELLRDTGVDAVSFGGTKNGILFGEAVVFLTPGLGEDFAFYRKQGMQLVSKMRFVAAQFLALMDGDLWLENARHANAMARRLADGVRTVKGVRVTRPVDANAVFATLPAAAVATLQKEAFFYVWDEVASEVRWMMSFDTTEQDVDQFVEAVKRSSR